MKWLWTALFGRRRRRQCSCLECMHRRSMQTPQERSQYEVRHRKPFKKEWGYEYLRRPPQ
jgi:hypothetical protein